MTPETLAALHAKAFTRQRPWTAQEIAALLDNPHTFLCPGPHGFALGRAVVDEAELLTLATDPAHRRQGHARACLLAFQETARRRGATQAFLEVDQANTGAIALYESAGFTITAQRRDYYTLRYGTRVDALIMTKILTP